MTIKETLKFEQDLYHLINTCGLPVDTAFYVVKSVFLDFQNTLQEYAEKKQGGFSEKEQVIELPDAAEPIHLKMNGNSTREKGEQTDAEQ